MTPLPWWSKVGSFLFFGFCFLLVTSFLFFRILVHLHNKECIKMRELDLEETGPCSLSNTSEKYCHGCVVLSPSNLSFGASTFRFKEHIIPVEMCCYATRTWKVFVPFESIQQSKMKQNFDHTTETMCLLWSKPVGPIARHILAADLTGAASML